MLSCTRSDVVYWKPAPQMRLKISNMTIGMICKYITIQNAGSSVSDFTCRRGGSSGGKDESVMCICTRERMRRECDNTRVTHRRPPPLALDLSHRTWVELLCDLGVNRSDSRENSSHALHADLCLGSGAA